MSKKIVSGISLALVLVMFAALLTGCPSYLYSKSGRKTSGEIRYVQVGVYQEENDGKYSNDYDIHIEALDLADKSYSFSGRQEGVVATMNKDRTYKISTTVQVKGNSDSGRNDYRYITVTTSNFKIDENSKKAYKAAKITVSYGGDSLECK